MQPTKPYIRGIPGDNDQQFFNSSGGEVRPHIMARSGDCIGMSDRLAVWRFGFSPVSEAAQNYGVCLPDFIDNGFYWVLATRKTGKVKEIFRGSFVELPKKFKDVINWEP